MFTEYRPKWSGETDDLDLDLVFLTLTARSIHSIDYLRLEVSAALVEACDPYFAAAAVREAMLLLALDRMMLCLVTTGAFMICVTGRST